MESKSVGQEIPLVWTHWSADPSWAVGGRRSSRRSPCVSSSRVRVLPGNPSLPLRAFLGGLSRRRNGGLDGSDLGMDLSIRGHEVEKLFYAEKRRSYTAVLLREGHDPADFLQEVYRGLLARNRGTCPWDASKSSFGHYVHIVIGCVLANYLRRERLRDSREGVTEDGELPTRVSTVAGGTVELRDMLEGMYGEGDEVDRVQRYLGALYAGAGKREALGDESAEWGSRVLGEVRRELMDSL